MRQVERAFIKEQRRMRKLELENAKVALQNSGILSFFQFLKEARYGQYIFLPGDLIRWPTASLVGPKIVDRRLEDGRLRRFTAQGKIKVTCDSENFSIEVFTHQESWVGSRKVKNFDKLVEGATFPRNDRNILNHAMVALTKHSVLGQLPQDAYAEINAKVDELSLR